MPETHVFSKLTCFPTPFPPGIHIISHPHVYLEARQEDTWFAAMNRFLASRQGVMCFLTQQKGHWANGKRIVLNNVDMNLGSNCNNCLVSMKFKLMGAFTETLVFGGIDSVSCYVAEAS